VTKKKRTRVKGPQAPNPLGSLVIAEVTREESRRQDFRTRSVSLLGISSGIVAIMTGLVVIAVRRPSIQFTLSSTIFAIAALVALIGSACFTLVINTSTHDYVVGDVRDLRIEVDCEWETPGWDQRIARSEVDYLNRLRKSNSKKQWLLNMSIFFQILGVALIAAAAVVVVNH